MPKLEINIRDIADGKVEYTIDSTPFPGEHDKPEALTMAQFLAVKIEAFTNVQAEELNSEDE